MALEEVGFGLTPSGFDFHRTMEQTMRISFHEDSVAVDGLCRDLRSHGAVYWPSTRPSFKEVADQVKAKGLHVLGLCPRPQGDFMDFLSRLELVDDLDDVLERVAAAIIRWQDLGESVPHVEDL